VTTHGNRTDHQAEVFLEHGLRTWAGINLRDAGGSLPRA
jgi:hypothetical protein